MKITQKIIDDLTVALAHTKKDGTENWKDGDEIDVCLGGTFIKPHRLHTDMLVKELKILINEVLDEREGKKGISYFDTDKFKYRVGEQEPPYEKWV